MKKIEISTNDLKNLKDLFSENYLIIKQTKEYEKKVFDDKNRIILKQIRDIHQDNLLTIMKLLDEKERII